MTRRDLLRALAAPVLAPLEQCGTSASTLTDAQRIKDLEDKVLFLTLMVISLKNIVTAPTGIPPAKGKI